MIDFTFFLFFIGTEATYILSFQPEGWVNAASDKIYAEV
jgi:hypothetical protein